MEWIPVITSALAVGFLTVPLLMRVGTTFFRWAAAVLVLQVLVGVAGFLFHFEADVNGVGKNLFEQVVHGAPVFAPLLFPNLAILAGIGLWVLRKNFADSTHLTR